MLIAVWRDCCMPATWRAAMARAPWAGRPSAPPAALWRWRRPACWATGPISIPYGVMVAALTGGIGGLFGQLDAMMKAFLKHCGEEIAGWRGQQARKGLGA